MAQPPQPDQPVTDRPGVSVVIPTRNRRRLLQRTLSGVLGQVDVDLEVIVVDDGSSDDTQAFLRGLGDDRLRVVRHATSIGPSQARNAGIDLVSAPFVAFTDDDDLWAPRKLAEQLSSVQRDADARWSCVGAVSVDDGLRIVRARRPPSGPHLTRDLLASDTVPGGGSGVVAETALVRSLGGFDTRLRLLADWDMWIRLGLHSPMAGCDRPLMAYLRHSQSLSGAGSRIFEREYAYMRTKFQAARQRFGAELSEAETLLWVADSDARAGRRWPAVGRYLQVARRHRSRSAAKRMAAVAVWPSALRLVDRNERRRIPADWMAEADAWLHPYRTGGHDPSSTGGVRPCGEQRNGSWS
jgi:GT2 family glycosyltransferase